jgi:hypothetical protein
MDTISVDFALKPMCLPLYKKEPPGMFTRTHPHFSLISQFHVLSLLILFTLRDLVMALGYFIAGIYVLLSHIIAIYICIDLYLFSLRHFFGIFYIM